MTPTEQIVVCALAWYDAHNAMQDYLESDEIDDAKFQTLNFADANAVCALIGAVYKYRQQCGELCVQTVDLGKHIDAARERLKR
jgi:hypothetical protein